MFSKKTFCQGDMIEDLGDLLVEDGEEMFEALSQMPVISISTLDSDFKSICPGFKFRFFTQAEEKHS